MALEPGGFSEKLGNHYEGRWVARQLIYLLLEKLASVEVEKVGDDEVGVDLWIGRHDGSREAQQCKIRNSSSEHWTIPDLKRRGVLEHAKFQLNRDSMIRYALVSAVPFTMLHDLCESARLSGGVAEEFYAHQVNALGEPRRLLFKVLCSALGLDVEVAQGRAVAYDYLQRTDVILHPDDRYRSEELETLAWLTVDGNPQVTISVLCDFAQDSLRKKIDAGMVWNHLRSRGLYPRKLDKDPRAISAIQYLRDSFQNSIRPKLIRRTPLPRPEAQAVVEQLENAGVILVHGRPGEGKSSLLLQIVDLLIGAGWEYIPLRLDRHEPRETARKFGEALGLPDTPSKCLSAFGKERLGVLIIDQLDAIRWTSPAASMALDLCDALVRETLALRGAGYKVSVLLACRTYELEHDPQIRDWIARLEADRRHLPKVLVGPLPEDQVTSVVQAIGHDIAELSTKQRSILRNANILEKWVDLVSKGQGVDFKTPLDVLQQYVDHCLQETAARQRTSLESLNSQVDGLAAYMDKHATLSAPRSMIQRGDDALLSSGLFECERGQIRFTHQSLFDYLFADQLVRQIHSGTGTLLGWLDSRSKQNLARREQLKMALTLLSAGSTNAFLCAAKDILETDSVRFHLKHLVLEVIGQIEFPEPGLHTYLVKRFTDASWQDYIHRIVYTGRPQHVEWLIRNGFIAEWLQAPELRDRALQILRSVAKVLPDEVVSLLKPYEALDDEWDWRILNTICWDPADDSDSMFGLRLALIRRGIIREFVDVDKLAFSRALLVLDATVSRIEVTDWDEFGRMNDLAMKLRLRHWLADDSARLTSQVSEMPAKVWSMFLPHITRLFPQEDPHDCHLENWVDGDRYDHRSGLQCIPHLLYELLVSAGRALAAQDATDFWGGTLDLRSCPLRAIQHLLIDVYIDLAAGHADDALLWLVADVSRLAIGTGTTEPEWMPAARLLEVHSRHCTNATFSIVEHALAHYRSRTELRDAKYHVAYWKSGRTPYFWGQGQYFLLPALPQDRISSSTDQLIRLLKRRFAKERPGYFLRRPVPMGGRVASPVSGKWSNLSDAAWLGIVSSRRVHTRRGGRWKQLDVGTVSESSSRQFADDLRNAASANPHRFAQLALRFPSEAHTDYKSAIVDGMACVSAPSGFTDLDKASWQFADKPLVEAVLARFGDQTDDGYAYSFCGLIEKRSNEDWSEPILLRLVEYALMHPNPSPEKLTVWTQGNSSELASASVSDLENSSINCVRGSALHAISACIRHREHLLDLFRPCLGKASLDRSPIVRLAAVEAMLPVLNLDRDLAISLFCESVQDDLRIAAARASVYYFNCGFPKWRDHLEELVRKMLASESESVAREGAREVAARWLFHGFFENELEACLRGTEAHRVGIANVAADQISESKHAARCGDLIRRLMADSASKVRDELRVVLHHPDTLRRNGQEVLLLELVNSEVFREDPTILILRLEDYRGPLIPLSPILFSVCDQLAGGVTSLNQRIAWDVRQFIPILLRLLNEAEQCGETTITDRVLDAIDSLYKSGIAVGDLIKEMAE